MNKNKREEIIDKRSPREKLDDISLHYLNYQATKYSDYEMEAKFGTRGIKPISKHDYDNVVKKLKSSGFTTINDNGSYSLKIQPEFLDIQTGQFKTNKDVDRFRIDIQDLTNIQEYCRTNDLKHINNNKPAFVKIMKKTDVYPIQSANFDDFNFRVTLKNEESISKTSKIGLEIFDNWNKSKKIFRYINRVSFIHPEHDFVIDLSIVRSSSINIINGRKQMIKTYNIDESNVFNNEETYEIEIEALSKIRQSIKEPKKLSESLQKVIKIVLSGLQKTNFPISYLEQRNVGKDYLKLLFEKEYKENGQEYVPKERLYPSDFVGPSSKTLQIKNICEINADFNVPNITYPYSYCVTDKADGDRHLLYINNSGKIYLIDTNMNIIFTGAQTTEEQCFNSLLDGELILHNLLGNFINKYAAFDIYYIANNDVRSLPFMYVPSKDKKLFEKGTRLQLLNDFEKKLKPVSITMKKSVSTDKNKISEMLEKYKTLSPIDIITKKFYPYFDQQKDEDSRTNKYSIFEANNHILRKIQEKNYEYEIDGLIFTPTLFGVGSNKTFETGPKKKTTWEYSFKWKPSEATSTFPHSYNTIDFLVFTKKGPDGNDIVTPIFENGINSNESTQLNQYKTLQLAVGFDEKKHGYINPCQDILDDKLPLHKDIDNEDTYKPKQFYPSDPFDPMAGLCNIMLEMDSLGNYKMFTEENEVFEDNTIIEFRYDITKPGLWKWIPLRVRYDKTAEFRQGNNTFGNDYRTANDNWFSIHNPITENMIATGNNIPSIAVADDVYYNNVTQEKLTKGMRDFHNLYVKKILIQSVSRKGNTLIDLACGKGGDLTKWIASELSFVFGIDISKDNIENRLNGACARYLNFRKEFKTMPYALFVNGNSSLNIRDGTNMFTDKANSITKAVFGINSFDKSLGPGVERQYAKGANGFDITSCQFAIHYMFKDRKTFYNFIRNVAEVTKINGYFIATCYDGKTIFKLLKKMKQGETKDTYIDNKKVWSITKNYDAETMEDNDSCLGYEISVYQDSINQLISEYLVNFDFLTNTLDKYGFSLVSRDEAKKIGLPEGSGMFIELYNEMLKEIKKDPSKEKEYKDAINMKNYEKEISFLNRYLVFKKTSSRNAEKLTRSILEQLPEEDALETAGLALARETIKQVDKEMKPKVKKLDKKIKLIEASDVSEDKQEQNTKELINVKEQITKELINDKQIEDKQIEDKQIKKMTKTNKSSSDVKKITRRKKPIQDVEFIIEE